MRIIRSSDQLEQAKVGNCWSFLKYNDEEFNLEDFTLKEEYVEFLQEIIPFKKEGNLYLNVNFFLATLLRAAFKFPEIQDTALEAKKLGYTPLECLYYSYLLLKPYWYMWGFNYTNIGGKNFSSDLKNPMPDGNPGTLTFILDIDLLKKKQKKFSKLKYLNINLCYQVDNCVVPKEIFSTNYSLKKRIELVDNYIKTIKK